MDKLEAVEQVFGMPDTWTVRPVTFGEMDPVVEMSRVFDREYPDEDAQSCIVAELAYNEHKYERAENATKENGWICVCGYPAANHPQECFE